MQGNVQTLPEATIFTIVNQKRDSYHIRLADGTLLWINAADCTRSQIYDGFVASMFIELITRITKEITALIFRCQTPFLELSHYPQGVYLP